MKLHHLSLIILLILSTTTAKAEKYGLIIAIGDYPSAGMWPKISSQNDILLVETALSSLGFEKKNIFQITDTAATRAGILQAFADLESILKAGDIVYIHFSGHGQQVVDDNSDEIDQLDEAIVPYDSPMQFKAGIYEGERLIRDDEINTITTAMRRLAGPDGQLILILDSCHSGTGTRGMAKARGTATIMAPDGFDATAAATETSTNLTPDANDAALAPMASFFGASPRELNYETIDDTKRPVGSLTYAMSKTLTAMREAYSFEELFDNVRTQMKVFAPRQHPQWEGPSDVLLLGGAKLPNRDRYIVEEWLSNTQLIASVGTVAGTYVSSTVEVVDRENTVLARGSISNASLTKSTISLDESLQVEEGQLLYVRVTEPALPPLTVSVHTDVVSEHWQAAISNLEALPIYEPTQENAEVYITTCNDETAIQLATGDGSIIDVIEFDEVDPSRNKRRLEQAVRGFLQGKFIRGFDNPGSAYDFDLRINVVDCSTGKNLAETASYKLTIGTCVNFVITNDGVKGAYFSVLDIQPDNVINVVIPDVTNDRTSSEYYLKPGESFTMPDIIEIAQPAGAETLKLLASKEPLDMAGIIATKGNSRRGVGAASSFETYMASTYSSSTRGTKVKKKQGEDIGVKTVFFTIVK